MRTIQKFQSKKHNLTVLLVFHSGWYQVQLTKGDFKDSSAIFTSYGLALQLFAQWAGLKEAICNVCGKPVDKPYRRKAVGGGIVEGCVANYHDGVLSGEDLEWHNRPEAVKARNAECEERVAV